MPKSNADRPDAALFTVLTDDQIERLAESMSKGAYREGLHGNHALADDLHEVYADLDGGFWAKRKGGR